jgi:hypothetical protein
MDMTINKDALQGGHTTSRGFKPLLVRLADSFNSHSLASRLFGSAFVGLASRRTSAKTLARP